MSYPSVKETPVPGLFAYNICGTTFLLDHKYAPLKFVGYGSYGALCAAKDTSTPDGRVVVIEKVEDALAQPAEVRALLREITLSKQLAHPNVIQLHEVMRPRSCPQDLYLVFEAMAVDLREFKRSSPMDARHVQVLAYQLLAALNHLHSAGVTHGDVRPSNLLVDEEFNIKLSKLGKAISAVDAAAHVTPVLEHPLWYYAPELLAGRTSCSAAADVWASGIVILEALARRHFIKGRTPEQTLASINASLGGTDGWVETVQLRSAIAALVAGVSDDLIELLQGMLQFDPVERVTAEQALKHKFFDAVRGLFESVPAALGVSLPQLGEDEVVREALLQLVSREMPDV